MFSYERRVVTSMLTTDDQAQRSEVVAFVGGALAAMPEFLRLGITAITVALTAWSGLRRVVGAGRSGPDDLAWLKTHPIGLVRQWVRALQSLVLFAENEKMEAATP
ncbi:hypothetical protein KSP35_04635 [Aquihabitans sp. G128]|uniref:hypothetical protein n=1 Tax=Aquihabitans sp. G128 TaxID=2849779 RepID=UPI001C22C9B5|nr:hypothetical protein [Aquihabitans sp. G128]QXC62101.1 hypothetical protein KSP35_04635 [Aquihabitans sp. G128]